MHAESAKLKQLRKETSDQSLLHTPPTEEERLVIHDLHLRTIENMKTVSFLELQCIIQSDTLLLLEQADYRLDAGHQAHLSPCLPAS